MNKTELVEKIAAGAGISKVDAKKALEQRRLLMLL